MLILFPDSGAIISEWIKQFFHPFALVIKWTHDNHNWRLFIAFRLILFYWLQRLLLSLFCILAVVTHASPFATTKGQRDDMHGTLGHCDCCCCCCRCCYCCCILHCKWSLRFAMQSTRIGSHLRDLIINSICRKAIWYTKLLLRH